MALNLEGIPQLFQHSKEFDQGQGKVRKGAGTFVVALDGSGDFSDIQEAINALPSTGGSIYIKEGIYEVTKSIIIKVSNTTIIGAGIGTIIKGVNGAAGTFTSGAVIYSSGKNSLQIENLYITSGVGSFSSRSLYIEAGFNINLYNLQTTQKASIDDIDFSKISNNFFASGFELSGTTNKGIVIVSNRIAGISETGVSGISYSSITANFVYDDGILLQEMVNCVIVGNAIEQGNSGGIVLTGGDRNTITGNSIYATSEQGIYLIGSNNNIISSNSSEGNSQYGINVDANSDRNVVIGNICLNNTVGQILNNGTNTELGHNIIV